MGEGEIVRNPVYAGLQPQLLEPTCHDRSALLSVHCNCGADSHLHETQLDGLPKRTKQLGLRCSGCREPLVMQLKDLRQAFQQMRDEGWHRADG